MGTIRSIPILQARDVGRRYGPTIQGIGILDQISSAIYFNMPYSVITRLQDPRIDWLWDRILRDLDTHVLQVGQISFGVQ